MARASILWLLAGVALMGCHTNSGPGTQLHRLHYGSGEAQLAWAMVTPPYEAEPPAAEGLEFRILPPLRIEGDELQLTGELANHGDQPVPVQLFGVDWQPFTLSLDYVDGMHWQPPYPGWIAQPPAPPPPFRITVPARTAVEFTARYDLRTVAYAGSPATRVIWRFDFAGTREAASGALALTLPPR